MPVDTYNLSLPIYQTQVRAQSRVPHLNVCVLSGTCNHVFVCPFLCMCVSINSKWWRSQESKQALARGDEHSLSISLAERAKDGRRQTQGAGRWRHLSLNSRCSGFLSQPWGDSSLMLLKTSWGRAVSVKQKCVRLNIIYIHVWAPQLIQVLANPSCAQLLYKNRKSAINMLKLLQSWWTCQIVFLNELKFASKLRIMDRVSNLYQVMSVWVSACLFWNLWGWQGG